MYSLSFTRSLFQTCKHCCKIVKQSDFSLFFPMNSHVSLFVCDSLATNDSFNQISLITRPELQHIFLEAVLRFPLYSICWYYETIHCVVSSQHDKTDQLFQVQSVKSEKEMFIHSKELQIWEYYLTFEKFSQKPVLNNMRKYENIYVTYEELTALANSNSRTIDIL